MRDAALLVIVLELAVILGVALRVRHAVDRIERRGRPVAWPGLTMGDVMYGRRNDG